MLSHCISDEFLWHAVNYPLLIEEVKCEENDVSHDATI